MDLTRYPSIVTGLSVGHNSTLQLVSKSDKMRTYIITIFFLIFGLNFVHAQRFGYIDTDFILNKMPDYKKAQDEINQLSEAWEKEIQENKKKIKETAQSYTCHSRA